ncbi:MAG: tetratricopeptide repeat protein [Acidobacteria bacterium]|nr:tetratricopeptide repeat protein [Acidobacteriota bacterium]
MLLARLLKAYRRHGFLARTGLNPRYFDDPDCPFTHFQRANGETMNVGGGLAPQEIHFLEGLCEGAYRPRRILIVGNAFGWSAIALGMILPESVIVAMDAGLEGSAAGLGASLTMQIASEEHLSVRVVDALSPRDVAQVVATEFGGEPLDLVLIDGFHANEQLTRDFAGALPHASPSCVFVFHDVLHWHMVDAFKKLPIPASHERRILTRCPSGMGVVFPSTLDAAARDAIDAFCDETVDLAAFHASLGADDAHAGPPLRARLSRGWRMRHLGMASTYEMEGDPERAEEQIRLAAEDAAGDAEVLVRIAVHLMERDRWEDADRYLQDAHGLAPAWDQPLLERARVALHLGQDDVAAPLFAEAARLNPQCAVAWYELGRLSYHSGDDSNAVTQLERAIALEPAWDAPCHVLGLVKGRLEGAAAAIPWFERAVGLSPGHLHAHYDLGQARVALGDDRGATASFERAMEIDPDWAPPYYSRGLVAARAEGPAAAVSWFERAIARDPDWGWPLLELGAIRYHQGNDVAALALLERAVAVDPASAAAHHVLALVRSRLHGDAAGLADFERAIALAPQWEAPCFELGIRLRRLGQCNDAITQLVRAAELGCTERTLWYEVGLSRRAVGDDAGALEAFEAVHHRAPNWSAPLKELGVCLRQLNRLRESVDVLRSALEREPDWAGAHYELGLSCRALHDLSLAEHHWRRAADLRPGWDAPRVALAALSAPASR